MRDWLTATDRKVQIVNVKVHDVELRGALEQAFEHTI
jgi:hypothetical protein